MKFKVVSGEDCPQPINLLVWDEVIFEDGEDKIVKSITMHIDAGDTVTVDVEFYSPNVVQGPTGSFVTNSKQYAVAKDSLPQFTIPIIELH